MTTVFLLGHTHRKPDGEDDDKLIGIYESQDAARRAQERVGGQPGFADCPEGFLIEEHKVGVDSWTEGFVTVISLK